jgi:hypothetical protein
VTDIEAGGKGTGRAQLPAGSSTLAAEAIPETAWGSRLPAMVLVLAVEAGEADHLLQPVSWRGVTCGQPVS